MEAKQKLWQRISLGLILIAALILAYSLYNIRIQRIALTDTPFITDFFLILLIATAAFHLLLLSIQRFLNPAVVFAWIILSLFGWALLNGFLSGFAIYAFAYFFWLILLDIALLILVYHKQLAELQWQSAARAFGIALFGIFMTLLMLEIAMRLYFSFLGSQNDKIAYLYSVDQIVTASFRYQGYPYINYGLSPNHPEHNRDGYRGAEIENPKPEGVYRIFTLGGSTTFGASLSNQETYPAQLQTILRDDYGYSNIEVVNAGVSAYASADSLANLAYHVLDDEPDMIIIYDNINDVRSRFVAPEDYSGLNLQRGIWSPEKLAAGLSPSVLIRFIQIQLGLAKNPNNIESLISTNQRVERCSFQPNEMCNELNVPAQEILDSNPPIYFERNLVNMAAIARANDVDVLFATWAYYVGETPLPNAMSMEYIQNAADEHNEIIRRLATDLDIPMIDFAVSVPVDASFWQDGMHMTATGTREQAEQFAAFLVENALIPNP